MPPSRGIPRPRSGAALVKWEKRGSGLLGAEVLVRAQYCEGISTPRGFRTNPFVLPCFGGGQSFGTARGFSLGDGPKNEQPDSQNPL